MLNTLPLCSAFAQGRTPARWPLGYSLSAERAQIIFVIRRFPRQQQCRQQRRTAFL